jgi:hypothetical protein
LQLLNHVTLNTTLLNLGLSVIPASSVLIHSDHYLPGQLGDSPHYVKEAYDMVFEKIVLIAEIALFIINTASFFSFDLTTKQKACFWGAGIVLGLSPVYKELTWKFGGSERVQDLSKKIGVLNILILKILSIGFSSVVIANYFKGYSGISTGLAITGFYLRVNKEQFNGMFEILKSDEE